jgi:hypothetical protein
MKLSRILLRTAWIATGLAVSAAWGFMAVGTALAFLFSYGGPPGSYTGQMDDRHAAWSFLFVLAALSLMVAVAVVWPVTRWRRRRAMTYAAGSHSGTDGDEQPPVGA